MSDKGSARQVFAGIVAIASIFVAYQGFMNARLPPEFEPTAKAAACSFDTECVVKRDRPNEVRADPVRRRYEFHTNLGDVVTTCSREYWFVGEWKCQSALGTFTDIPSY